MTFRALFSPLQKEAVGQNLLKQIYHEASVPSLKVHASVTNSHVKTTLQMGPDSHVHWYMFAWRQMGSSSLVTAAHHHAWLWLNFWW